MNPTEREWVIKPVFSQSGHEFEGPKDFIAKKKQANGQASGGTTRLTGLV